MFRNYLKTSLRYLSKNKAYSAINILGLAVGLACFMLLTIFVKQEFSYDEFHTKKDNLYQLFLADTVDAQPEFTIATQGPAGPLIAESIPEIVKFSRYSSESEKVVKVGDQRFVINKITYADPETFHMFDFPLLFSNGKELNLSKDEILLSESEALKLFGTTEQALGQTLEILDLGSYTVKDVFEDLPENTILSFNYVLSFNHNAQKPFEGWGDKSIFDWGFLSAFPVIFELSGDDVDLSILESKIEEVIAPHETRLVKLVPITEMYFSELNKRWKRGNKQYVQLYLAIAFLILIVAAVNYMNLSTARLSKRSKEVGIRKTVGGHRNQIIKQFLIESMIISLCALVLSVCFAELSLPFMAELVDKQMEIDYLDPMVLTFIVGSGVLVGLVSGLYPALYLSKFSPIQVLSGKANSTSNKFSFRQVLVGFQLFTCLGLMTVTTIVFQQFKHMENLNKGFNDDQIVSISLTDKAVQKKYKLFKGELEQNPFVEQVTGSSFSVFSGQTSFYVKPEGTEEDQPITVMTVEQNFVHNLGIKIFKGEDFNHNNTELNKKKILINRAAQDKFNWDAPIGKKILNYEVIGVVDDFIYGSAKESIDPLMIIPKSDDFKHVYIKLSGENIQAAIDGIRTTYDQFAETYPFEYTFLDEDFAKKYDKEKRMSNVFTTFSILALFVAGLGILGLSIYLAEQRIKEIGIRRVLGAKVGNIIWLLNKGTTTLILVVAIIVLPAIHFTMSSWLTEYTNRIELGFSYYLIPLAALVLMIWLILLNQSIKSARQNLVNALRTE